jgi:hypothetical protein
VGVRLFRPTTITYKEWPLPRRATSEPGDLLFIQGGPDEQNPGHVMMFVEPGQIFQAAERGTRIGQFPYDTDIWEFRTRPGLALPMPKVAPTPAPTADELSRSLQILLTGPEQAHEAVANGWPLYKWDGYNFIPATDPGGIGTSEYAYFDYIQKHP